MLMIAEHLFLLRFYVYKRMPKNDIGLQFLNVMFNKFLHLPVGAPGSCCCASVFGFVVALFFHLLLWVFFVFVVIAVVNIFSTDCYKIF